MVPSILHLLCQIPSFRFYAIAYGRECRLVRLDFIAPLPCVACTLQYCHGHFITISDYPPPIPLSFYSINTPMFVVEPQKSNHPFIFTLVLVYRLVLVSLIVSIVFQRTLILLSTLVKIPILSPSVKLCPRTSLPLKPSLFIIFHRSSSPLISHRYSSL